MSETVAPHQNNWVNYPVATSLPNCSSPCCRLAVARCSSIISNLLWSKLITGTRKFNMEITTFLYSLLHYFLFYPMQVYQFVLPEHHEIKLVVCYKILADKVEPHEAILHENDEASRHCRHCRRRHVFANSNSPYSVIFCCLRHESRTARTVPSNYHDNGITHNGYQKECTII